jgi:MbtH protein
MKHDEADEKIYRVVINDEEQYSLLAADGPNPAGWRDAGKRGSRSECLSYINKVWTDMRPQSLRKDMAIPAITPVLSEVYSNGNYMNGKGKSV